MYRPATQRASNDLLTTPDDPALVQRGRRVVDDGLFTSAGVAAAIEMAFRIVQHRCGRSVADETARVIEFPLDLDALSRA